MTAMADLQLQTWMREWIRLEDELAGWLLYARARAGFLPALQSLQARLASLLEADTDGSLYWLFQRAALTSTQYSATHATLCACLCRVIAPALGLDAARRDSLALAALTMNLAMTQLQDQLVAQARAPDAAQRELIARHPALGAQWLADLGVKDKDWLLAVEQHHADAAGRLPRALAASDRYAALLSPRQHRSGRCVTDSARHVVVRRGAGLDSVGQALLRSLGLCPPGTFVRLEDGRIAVVLRRGATPGMPWVVPVLDAAGQPLADHELVDTSREGQGLEAALLASTVPVTLDHLQLLTLGRTVAPQQG
mgnify:CR=1 FL=1